MFRVLASALFLTVLVMPAESFSLRRRGEVPRSKTVVAGEASFSRSASGRPVSMPVDSPEVHVQLEPMANPASDGGFFESFGAGMPMERSDRRGAPLPPAERLMPSDRLRNSGVAPVSAPVAGNSRSLPSDRFLSAERPTFSGRDRDSQERVVQRRNPAPVDSPHQTDVSALPYRGQFYGSSPALFELDPGLVQRWDMLPELRPSMDVKGPGM